MKTKYKWIEFVSNIKGDEYECRNKEGHTLGIATYRNGWRQFIFNCDSTGAWAGIDFNFRCLEDISDFLKQLNETKGCYRKKVRSTEEGDTR